MWATAFTAAGLAAEYDGSLERALWTAVSTLEASAALSTKIAEPGRAIWNDRVIEIHRAAAEEKRRQADMLRAMLLELQRSDLMGKPTESVRQEYQPGPAEQRAEP
jgi:predicted NAD-dependent protein-ADP-ribosyltransferase YbiA (DUF1768 family)